MQVLPIAEHVDRASRLTARQLKGMRHLLHDTEVLCALQGLRQARDELCWQLHPEQLQLAPAAAGLVRTLTSIPIEAEERSLRISPLSGTL